MKGAQWDVRVPAHALAVNFQKALLPRFSRAARPRGKNFGLRFSFPANLMRHALFHNIIDLTLGIL